MNTNQVKGAVQKTGGEIRESVANVTGDTKGKILGQKDQVEGTATKAVGDTQEAVKKATNS